MSLSFRHEQQKLNDFAVIIVLDMSYPYPASWLHVTFVKTRVPVFPQRFTCEGCESTSFFQRTKEVS